jgi:hypothetical protein
MHVLAVITDTRQDHRILYITAGVVAAPSATGAVYDESLFSSSGGRSAGYRLTEGS